jgi:hypothetical protein
MDLTFFALGNDSRQGARVLAIKGETYRETFRRHFDTNNGELRVMNSGDQWKEFMKLQINA